MDSIEALVSAFTPQVIKPPAIATAKNKSSIVQSNSFRFPITNRISRLIPHVAFSVPSFGGHTRFRAVKYGPYIKGLVEGKYFKSSKHAVLLHADRQQSSDRPKTRISWDHIISKDSFESEDVPLPGIDGFPLQVMLLYSMF